MDELLRDIVERLEELKTTPQIQADRLTVNAAIGIVKAVFAAAKQGRDLEVEWFRERIDERNQFAGQLHSVNRVLIKAHEQRYIEVCTEVERLRKHVTALEQERDELIAIFDLQRKRERPWIERWRQETGKHDTLPDYGAMLEWVIGKADAAEAREQKLREALQAFIDLAPSEGHRCLCCGERVYAEDSTGEHSPDCEMVKGREALADGAESEGDANV